MIMSTEQPEKELNPRQKLFCIEYLKDLNATQAAIRAGYSEDTARQIGSENLSKPDIQEEIKRIVNELLIQAKIPLEKQIFDYWLKRATYNFLDIVNLDGTLKLNEGQTTEQKEAELIEKGLQVCIDGIERRMTESGKVTVKYKLADKDKANEMLSKYIQMIRDKIDLNLINVSIGKPPLPEDAYKE